MQNRWFALFAFLFLLLITPALYAAELLSGPMVGHTTPTSAKIWVETSEPALIKVHYWLEPRYQYGRSFGVPVVRGSAEGRTAAAFPHTGVIELQNLKTGWLVYYELEIDGRLRRPETPQVFSLMPPLLPNENRPNELANFSVALASCSYPARVPVQPVWEQLAMHRPAALMLIGDNNYMPEDAGAYDIPEEDARYMMSRYHRFLRDLPGLRTVLATTPTYGTWDDHDFGPNNSDRTFRWKDLTLSLFKQYYPNASAGLPNVPGVFTSFRIADVEFFILDDRYYRDPNEAADRKTMLGTGQLSWLRESLKKSTATFKVIVNGGTLLVDRLGSGEYWANFGNERDEFISWMFKEGITGVLFAAGDWHVGTLSRLHRPGDSYPLYELLSSNTGVRTLPILPGQIHQFHQAITPEYLGYNFGLFRFSGPRGNRMVTMQIIDDRGNVRIELQLKEKDLTPQWKERVAP